MLMYFIANRSCSLSFYYLHQGSLEVEFSYNKNITKK